MSDSLISRYFTSWSVDGRGPITRSIGNSATSGFIRDDAPHWSIESFIPVHTDVLIDYLLGRSDASEQQATIFRQQVAKIETILRQRNGVFHGRFARAYWPVDPDNDSYMPGEVEAIEKNAAADVGNGDTEKPEQQDRKPPPDLTELLELCEEVLAEAGYRKLSREDIEQCVGVASQWGVPLHVDFDLFDQLLVFARGDIVGTRLRRRLRRLYRPEAVNVPIYQRMFVLFQLKSDVVSQEELLASSLHLRMFKNIPKQDIDMLLPGTTVRITKIDRAKIIVPSLGGILMSVRKIAQFMLIFAALTLYSTAVLAGLILATIGYVVKSVLSYFQTKNRYLLNLTRNLYFQKLDTNAGAAFRVIQQAHRQACNEAVLAYFAILTADQPISTRRLRRRCERIVREGIGVEVDLRVDLALQRLTEMELVRQEGDRWMAV